MAVGLRLLQVAASAAQKRYAGGYRIVLVDGSEYAARERYEVKGKLAVFKLLTGEVVVSIPLDTINQQATRAANFKTPVPPTPSLTPVRPTVTPRWTKAPRIIMSGMPQP